MSPISKRLQEAIDTVRALREDQQDLLALELLERAQNLSEPPTRLLVEEHTELAAELAAARRGELATEEDVAAMYARCGIRD